MEISKAATGIFAAVCVAAGAGGAYLFTSSGRDAAPLAHEELVGTEAPAFAPVEQSEGVIADEPPAAQPADTQPAPEPRVVPAPRVAPRPSPRPEPPARSARAESAQASVAPPAPTETRPAVVPVEPPNITDNQPSRTVEPEEVYEELVVAADSVIGLQIETAVSSERAMVEDPVTARVTRDVRVGDRVAIPAGSRVQGEVTLVERGGRLRDRARLGVRFTSVVLADGTRIPIQTETIIREGDSPASESAAKIGGGAIGGAIIGGILGGAKGAAIGSAVGAGGGSAAVMAGGRNPATLTAGSPVTVRVEQPVTVTVEK